MQMPTGILGHTPGTTTDCDDIVTMIPGTNLTQTINIAGVVRTPPSWFRLHSLESVCHVF